MTTPINNSKQPVRFWPYAVWGSFILVIFVSAIIAPDYFSYKIRLAKIQEASNLATNIVAEISAADARSFITNKTLLQTAGKNVADNLMSPSLEANSSEIFDTFGKLITMLLGFISVLGVFFGYFVRKSLRETEEDIRDHIELNMNLWEKEKNRLLDEFTKKLTEITDHQKAIKSKSDEFDNIVEKSKKTLEALEIIAKSEQQKTSVIPTKTANAVAAIDADATLPTLP